MNIPFRFLLPVFVLFTLSTKSQDTLSIMHYNILNYGNYTTYCTANNNNIDQKDGYLQTIFAYIKPEIITVNEMAAGSSYAQRILNNTLNVNGVNYYSRAGYQNFSGGSLANMLFYDSRKLVLFSQNAVPTSLRDFNFYTFYYKPPQGITLTDTAYFTCIVVHLKAGSSATEAAERAAMTQTLMNYLASNNLTGNYLLMGDLNLYESSEQAYQNLTKYSTVPLRFYDPVEKEGGWHDNSFFAPWHTQSTSSSGNGCISSGGLDDRFDFILSSQDIINGSKLYKYIPGSYKIFGNDGLHFNTSIVSSPANNSVPQPVLTALAANSDHLPVMIKLRSDALLSANDNITAKSSLKISPNPASSYIVISGLTEDGGEISYSLTNITGQKLRQGSVERGNREYTIHLEGIDSGLYFLTMENINTGLRSAEKLIVNR